MTLASLLQRCTRPKATTMTPLDRLIRTAQLSRERLTITVTGNVTIARWSRGRGRRAEQVTDYRSTADLAQILTVLAQRVLPDEGVR